MRRTAERGILILVVGCWVLGCGTPPECETLCDTALRTVEACLDEWGVAWGESLGYLDADDHANWCATFLSEQLEMGQQRWGTVEGRDRMAQVCVDQTAWLEDAACDQYAGSWDLWSEFSGGE